MDRRSILKGTLVAGAALAVPARLPAQVRTGNPRDPLLAAIARREQAKAGDRLWRSDVVGIADFGLRSSDSRFHFVNLERGTVDSYLVTHGMGSDPEHDGWLNWFSNVPESLCTSRGAYLTYGWYTGRFGTSIRLDGLEADNSNALDRAIVMHRAAYAEEAHLERWGKLGRSNGCFAMGEEQFRRALLELGGGRVLFADRLGLAEDGSTIERPPQAAGDIRPLMPDPPRGDDIENPGVY